jgi:hypothetical protein
MTISPKFDPSINLGHVLTVVTLVLAAGGSYYGIRGDLDALAQRMQSAEKAVDRLADVVVASARQDEKLRAFEVRLDGMERRIERMERGK